MTDKPAMAMCEVCEVWQTLSSMAATIEDGHSIGYCCYACAGENVRGKFEGNVDDEGIGTALVLHAWSMVSGEDDYMSNEEWGYCGRFGRYLLFENNQGFVTYREYSTVDKAVAEYESLHAQGWGYSEDDYVIEDNWRYAGYAVTESLGNGKWTTLKFERLTRARAYFRIKAAKDGYWPNLWLSSERGNLQLLSY